MQVIISFMNLDGSSIQVIEKDGNPWFVAKDVAEILGYTDGKQAVRDHCKCPILLKGVESTPFTSSPRGITIIPVEMTGQVRHVKIIPMLRSSKNELRVKVSVTQ
jgi:hypothetical protein